MVVAARKMRGPDEREIVAERSEQRVVLQQPSQGLWEELVRVSQLRANSI